MPSFVGRPDIFVKAAQEESRSAKNA